MSDAGMTRAIIMDWVHAWKNRDFERMRETVDDKVSLDSGRGRLNGVNELIDFCDNGPSWVKVEIIEEMYEQDRGAIMYEALTTDGQRVRAVEFIDLYFGKVKSIRVAVSKLND